MGIVETWSTEDLATMVSDFRQGTIIIPLMKNRRESHQTAQTHFTTGDHDRQD